MKITFISKSPHGSAQELKINFLPPAASYLNLLELPLNFIQNPRSKHQKTQKMLQFPKNPKSTTQKTTLCKNRSGIVVIFFVWQTKSTLRALQATYAFLITTHVNKKWKSTFIDIKRQNPLLKNQTLILHLKLD